MVKKLTAVALMAAAFGAAAELKVAVLNVQRALSESDEAKAAAEQIQQDLEPDREALNKLREEIEALQEQLEKDAEILGEEEKRRIGKDIEDKRLDFEFGANKLQKELQDRHRRFCATWRPS